MRRLDPGLGSEKRVGGLRNSDEHPLPLASRGSRVLEYGCVNPEQSPRRGPDRPRERPPEDPGSLRRAHRPPAPARHARTRRLRRAGRAHPAARPGVPLRRRPHGADRPAPQRRRFPLLLGDLLGPNKDASNYRLTIDGLVDHPRSYTLADLEALPQTRIVHDVQCVTGWRVPGTPFEGVRLSHLLDAADPDQGPLGSSSPASTGRRRGLSVSRPRRPTTLVTTACRTSHSATTTETSPTCYVAAHVLLQVPSKWLSGITVTEDVRAGYWEDRGYDVDIVGAGRSNGRDNPPTS